MDGVSRLIDFCIYDNRALRTVDQVELCSLKGSLALDDVSVWSGPVSAELCSGLIRQSADFLSKLEVLLSGLEPCTLRNVFMRIAL